MDKKKILIVDDEADVLKVLEKRLMTAGFSVVKASNGRDAVAMAKIERPALIVLDVNMPVMDGSEAGQIIKNDPEMKHIPIIYLTCLITKQEERDAGNEVAGNFFIAKPYDSNELLNQIERLTLGR